MKEMIVCRICWIISDPSSMIICSLAFAAAWEWLLSWNRITSWHLQKLFSFYQSHHLKWTNCSLYQFTVAVCQTIYFELHLNKENFQPIHSVVDLSSRHDFLSCNKSIFHCNRLSCPKMIFLCCTRSENQVFQC